MVGTRGDRVVGKELSASYSDGYPEKLRNQNMDDEGVWIHHYVYTPMYTSVYSYIYTPVYSYIYWFLPNVTPFYTVDA